MRADVKAELDRLKALHANQRLEPKLVVEAARDPKSPLHSFFTWNTREAAAKQLLQEARQLVAKYYEVQITSSGEPVKIRHYVSLTTDRVNGGGYRMLDDVMNDDQMREQMLADALAELQVFQAKYSRLKQLQPVFEAIEKVVQPRRRSRSKARDEARV